MGQAQSIPGPAGKDGKDGKDAVVDYIQLVNKTVNDTNFQNKIKELLGDPVFRQTVTDYMSANADKFRGPKGETEFKNLTADDQAKIIDKIITDNLTTFSVALMANQSFKDAVLGMLNSNPTNFRGPKGEQGPMGIGIKAATYDDTTGKLKVVDTNDQALGEFVVKGPQGPKGETGPAGTINTPDNITWLQGRTMWCADGSCKIPGAINVSAGKAISFDNSVGDKAYWSGNGYKTGTASWGLYHDIPEDKQHVFKVNNIDKMKIGKDGVDVGGQINVNGGISANTIVSKGTDGSGSASVWNWLKVQRADGDLYFGGDPTNRGIFSYGTRPVTIYTNDGKAGLTINNGDVTVAGKLIVNGRDILAELDNRVKYDNDWIQMQSDATNAGGAICVDAGSLSANCNWNNGYRRFKFTKVQR